MHGILRLDQTVRILPMSLRHFFIVISFFALCGEVTGQHVLSGFYQPDTDSDACLSPLEEAAIQQKLNQAIQVLQEQGQLTEPALSRTVAVRMSPPLQCARSSGYEEISAISNQVDHNPRSGSLDYNCGSRSYDGHTGTDYFPRPFPWTSMTEDWAQVVAAAPGTIVMKQDGFFDRECSLGARDWNAIYIRHSDGSVTWYGHFKAGSLTDKSAGDEVAAGEFLGIVGSSGNSTGPHLHFEIHDAEGKLVDPFAGSCNNTTRESWWMRQESYPLSRINLVAFHDQLPEMSVCYTDDEELPHFQNRFYPGETLYLGLYYRDPRTSQNVKIRVYQPDGRLFKQWEQIVSFTALAGYDILQIRLNRKPTFGTWTAKIEYEGEVVEKTFQLCASEDYCTCNQPTALRQTSIEYTSLGMYWDGPENADEYQIRVESSERPTRNYYSSDNNIDVTSLVPGSDVSWQVRASCGYLTSDWSGLLSSRMPYSSSTADTPEATDGSDLYATELPPMRISNGWRWAGSPNSSLLLYDLSGQELVRSEASSSIQAPFGLPAGLYLLIRMDANGHKQFARVNW